MLPLNQLMQKVNSSYYKRKNPRLYSDFLTYAQSKNNVLAQATAINFLSKFKNTNKKNLNILEIGCGNGNFAISFLNYISKKDKNLLNKINYFLADFSLPILDLAYKNIKKEFFDLNLKKIKFDANNYKKFNLNQTFDHIRANELLTDLAAKVFVKNKNIYEVKYDLELNFSFSKTKKLEREIIKTLNYFPEGFFIPINFTAKKLLFYLYKKLENGGYAEFFDYGFFSNQDFILEPYEWNNLVVRKYSFQITVDLNFFYLFNFFKSKNVVCDVKLQKDYVKNLFGKKVQLIEKKDGLDYIFKKSLIVDEEDYFYVLSFQK